MKVLAKIEERCIGCHLCEETCSQAYFKEKNLKKASLKVTEIVDGNNEIITCTQCGECIDICPVEAIYRDNRGIIRIRKDICVGCLMCVGFCNEGAMFYHDELTEPFKCISCGLCVKKCPANAIYIEDISM